MKFKFHISKKLLIGSLILYCSGVAFADSLGRIGENVLTDFNKEVECPEIDSSAYVSPDATVIGHVMIGKRVYLGPHSFVRGDEGQPLHVGDESNIQDGAGIHALETEEWDEKEHKWEQLPNRRFSADGERLSAEDSNDITGFAVYIGEKVSIAHQALVHGPAYVGDNTFVGMQSQIFNAKVEENVAIGVKSLITGGVTIPHDRYVPPGSVITTQAQADALGPRVGSPYEHTNEAVVHVNTSLADAYNNQVVSGNCHHPHRRH